MSGAPANKFQGIKYQTLGYLGMDPMRCFKNGSLTQATNC